MNHKQETHSRIVKHFACEIYSDIFMVLIALIFILGIPIIFSTAWTPNLIAEKGYLEAWFIWFMGIMFVTTMCTLLVTLIYTWINTRWEKAKKNVEAENGRK